MKHLLLTTIAAVLVVGCGPKAPDISIHKAAYDGNIEAVKQHLAAGTDVNAKNNDGWTPLHFAGDRGGHRKITEIILKEAKPADRPARWPPLQSAFWKSHNEIIELLISNGADVNAKANDDATPLNVVSMFKHPEIADLLRKHGGKTGSELRDWNAAKESIHIAAKAGHIEAVKKHLADGADVNAKDDNGSTPLHTATWRSTIETMELLIDNGADVNMKRADGAIALHYAVWFALKEKTEFLLSKGSDVKARDGNNEGATPLHVAVWKSPNNGIVELLIENEADVNDKNNSGETPLDWAIKYKRTELADLLRKHGGKHGTIHGAARGGDIEVVKEFLATGTDVNAKSSWNGSTPLHHAAEYGHKEVAELLIAEGADVNAPAKYGLTPLDVAIQSSTFLKGHPEIADLLRKHGGKTAEELEVKLTFNSDGTVSNSTHKLLAGWKFNEVDNNKTSIKTTAGLPLTLRVNIEQARPNGKGGLAIPALNPNESLSVRLEHNDLGEKLFSEYVVGVKVKIISSLTSEFFSIFDTGQPHPDGFYATEEENLQYKADAEIYVKDNEGIGILGDYVGGEKIINDEHNWFIIEIKEDLDFLVINKYINGEHVGTQRERSLFGTKRYKLQAGKEAKPVSFFVDNDSETKPCIVSEIFLSVPDLLRTHGGKTGVELEAEGK